MRASTIGNRRARLVVIAVGFATSFMAMSVHADTTVFDGGVVGTTAGATSDRDAVNADGFGQQVCDDFTPGADARTVTDIEWKGLYGVLGETVASERFAPTDEFSIIFYDDDGGMPGTVISQYHPRNVTRLMLADGAWSYHYSLPNSLSFEPGRPYHIAIVNNLPGNDYWCWSQDESYGSNQSSPTGSPQWTQWPGNCVFRLSYSEPTAEASAKLPILLVGLIASCAFGLHRYVL